MSTKADDQVHGKTRRAAFGHWPAEQTFLGGGKREGDGFDPQEGCSATNDAVRTIERFFVQPALIYPHHTEWVSNTDWPAPTPRG